MEVDEYHTKNKILIVKLRSEIGTLHKKRFDID